MATWDKGSKNFTCTGCGAVYRADWGDYPDRERSSYDCELCGTEVHNWHGTRTYDTWTLIKKPAGQP